MRPRKIVLLVNADERERSLMRFVLDTAGYRALTAADAESAIEMCRLHCLDCAVITLPLRPARERETLLAEIREAAPTVPRLLIQRAPLDDGSPAWTVDAHRVLVAPVMALELRECIRMMVARKRGPRKVTVPVAAAAAVVCEVTA